MPARVNSHNTQDPCEFICLGQTEYTGALARQRAVQSAKLANPDFLDTVFFVEHPGVYTLGRRGGRENLMVSQTFLDDRGIQVIQIDRGGNITYHGPGQAVLYPVIDLEKHHLSIPDYVNGLEEIMKQTCRQFGVSAHRDIRNPGLWVKNAKIGSVGISLKRGIAIHGLALNINPDLTPFSWINPCGLPSLAMTSIARETGRAERTLGHPSPPEAVSLMKTVCHSFAQYFSEVFNIPLQKQGKPDQQKSDKNKDACHAHL